MDTGRPKPDTLTQRIKFLLDDWDPDYSVFCEKILAAVHSQNKQGDDHSDKVKKILKIIESYEQTCQEKNVFDLLYELLTTCPGSSGPHSFKYALLAGLFDLTLEDQVNSKQIVDDFVLALMYLKKVQRKEITAEMVKLINDMTDEQFDNALDYALTLKGSMDSDALKLIYTPTLFFREISARITSSKVESERMGVLDATYKILTMAAAQEGQHSFKFIFLLHLVGYSVRTGIKLSSINKDTMYACLTIENESKTKISNYLFSTFAKGDKDESSFIIQDMIYRIEEFRKIQLKKMHNEVTDVIEKCIKGDVTRDFFSTTIKTVREERKNEERDNQASRNSITNFFAYVGTNKKTTDREQQLEKLLTSLQSSIQNPLQAFISFLQEGAGSLGPHSFKYKLLKRLFPTLNDGIKVTEVESTATIKLFIDIGLKMLKQAPGDIPLEITHTSAKKSYA